MVPPEYLTACKDRKSDFQLEISEMTEAMTKSEADAEAGRGSVFNDADGMAERRKRKQGGLSHFAGGGTEEGLGETGSVQTDREER